MNTLASNNVLKTQLPHIMITEDKKQFFPIPAVQLGILVFLATATMLFAAFTSSYLIRRSMSDWQPISLPTILYLNTFVLLLSSVSLERAKAALWSPPKADSAAARKWLLLTGLLGIGFLAGQMRAWFDLSAQGIFLSTNPHSSFFYILTGLHGLHLLGGLAMLFYLMASLAHRPAEETMRQRFRAGAMYWHFLSGLWVALFIVIFFI